MKYLIAIGFLGLLAACTSVYYPPPPTVDIVSQDLTKAEGVCVLHEIYVPNPIAKLGVILAYDEPYFSEYCPTINKKYNEMIQRDLQQEHEKALREDKSAINKALSE